jgi:putrescine transport system ATP-binding protein
MMEVRNIGKAFGNQEVLLDIQLHVAQGKTLAVLGKSGCGKTTLLRIIAGLESPDSGVVLLDDADVAHVPVHQRNAVYINQEPLLFPHMTARENIAYGLKARKMSSGDIKRQTDDMLQQLGLEAHGKKFPHQLSGGQKQRISFGRAIIIQPSVLLLDEPFGNLDADTRTQMQNVFIQLSRTYHITSLLVTHDLKEAILLGDETAYMENGRLFTYTDTGKFLADPRTGGEKEMKFWQQFMQSK